MNDLINLGEISNLSTFDKVILIEKELKKHEQLEIPVKHYFAHDSYAREITIPKGTILTGHIHKFSQINILAKGDISVLVDGEIKRIVAPSVIVSPPGIKRIAYANEETVWITIHGTNETNIEEIENKFIAKDEKEYLDYCNRLQIEEK